MCQILAKEQYTGCISNAWKKFMTQIPTPKQGKYLLQFMSAKFPRYSPTACRNQSFRFLSVGIFNNPRIFSAFCYACKTIRNRPGTLQMVGESIIRNIHLCTDKGGENFEHFYWYVTQYIYLKCILSVVSKILHNLGIYFWRYFINWTPGILILGYMLT